MASGAMMRSNFQRFLFPGLRDIILNEYQQPTAFEDCLRVESSSAAFEEMRTLAGMGLFVKTPEGTESPIDAFKDGFPKRFQHDDWSLAVGHSHQMLRDTKNMRIINERASDLGRSARSTREITNSSPYNLAFDGSTLGPDGVALCSSAHPNVKGGTQSNIVTLVGTLSIATVRSALTQARRFFDDTGVRRVSWRLEKLIVPPELEFDAQEILTSAGRPDTANRADNVLKGRLSSYVHDYLEDTNNYFFQTDKKSHNIYVFVRERFNTRTYLDESPRVMWLSAAYAESVGWSHWCGLLGAVVA